MIEIFKNYWEAMRKLVTGERMDKREANMVFRLHVFACGTLILMSLTSRYYISYLLALLEQEKNLQENVSVLVWVLSAISVTSALLGLIYFIRITFLLGFGKYPNFKQAFYK